MGARLEATNSTSQTRKRAARSTSVRSARSPVPNAPAKPATAWKPMPTVVQTARKFNMNKAAPKAASQLITNPRPTAL
eukprot:2138156-Amphidinium_carterae.1